MGSAPYLGGGFGHFYAYAPEKFTIWPWYGALALNRLYDAAKFLDLRSYKNVMRWAKEIDQRPAVKRGVI